ncbi:MAG: hypothetical protein E7331_09815 [Clostridiales bacterium]|nr:hypothetical protein [Clostridiales bacterium]
MKRLIVLIMIPLLMTVSGCSLSVMDRQAYALCMCVDMESDGRLTVGIFAPMSDSTDDSSAAPGYTLFTGTGETLEDAFTILAASNACRINFSQMKLCVLGADLARQRPLRPLLMEINALHDMRPECIVMVSRTTGTDFLEAVKPDFGLRMSTYLIQTLKRLQNASLSPGSTLVRTLRDLADPEGQVLLAICAVNPALKEDSGGGGDKPDQPKEAGESQASFASSGETSPWSGIMAGDIPRKGMNPVEFPGSALVENGVVTAFYDAEITQRLLSLRNR